jgi:hypothetical protein
MSGTFIPNSEAKSEATQFEKADVVRNAYPGGLEVLKDIMIRIVMLIPNFCINDSQAWYGATQSTR